MRCHYEVLDISRDADESQIKSAYRKLALKWHPDKNLNDEDHAKEQFQLVQQAYEILIDRQERAWYDNHREQILRGSDSEYEDNCLNVFQYFTTTCYKGFNDDENGFYFVYRKVFDEITKEDLEFVENKQEFFTIPTFGTSSSDYEEIVGPFYAYWMSYTTKKSYVWLDPYNIKETRERKLLKLMEKENNKIRQKARKERNDEVRSLVAFVKKRDKRVIEYSKRLEAKVQENRQKQEKLSKLKRLERKKDLIENHCEAEWSRFDNVQSELEEIEKSLAEEFGEDLSECSDDSYEDELNNLYCVACNKLFKTAKAFQNHELSKKHKENVVILKDAFLEEDAQNGSVLDDEENFSIASGSEDYNDVEKTKSKKKVKKNKKVINICSEEEEDSVLVNNNVHQADCGNFTEPKKTKPKKNKRRSTNKFDSGDSKEVLQKSEDQVAPQKSKQERKEKTKQMVGNDQTPSIHVDTDHCCVTCKGNFPSKNKLFDHLKKTGHSVYIPSEPDKFVKTKKKGLKGN